MCRKNFLIRLSAGIYLYPKIDDEIGIIYPSIEAIAKTIVKREKTRIILLTSSVSHSNRRRGCGGIESSQGVIINMFHLPPGASNPLQKREARWNVVISSLKFHFTGLQRGEIAVVSLSHRFSCLYRMIYCFAYHILNLSPL
jgi:hypothetical protein